MAQQITPLAGYPVDIGTKHFEVAMYTGPATYVTGGDPVYASTFGWGGFDRISGGVLDSSATYYIQPVFASDNLAKTVVYLKWIVAATGVEYAGGVGTATLTARLEFIGV